MQGLVWLGGLAFAASLSYLVYFYAIVLARTNGHDSQVGPSIAINTALFSLFALHHSILARSAIKRHVAHLVGGYERSLYVWVASALLFAVCVFWQSVPGMIYNVDGSGRVLLYGVQLLGAVFTIRGAGVVDVRELAGWKATTSVPPRDGETTVQAPTIKSSGPFRVVRHPIYLGWMLMVFAAPTMTSNRLLFAIISSTYLILAIPWEEKSLVEVHGDQYRAYQRTVRWRVLPGLW